MIDYPFIVAGAVTGAVVGLTGVGAGAIMTPMLILIFGVNPGIAVATDLWFAGLTKCVGAHVYHRSNQIDWPVVRLLWSGSLPAALITAMVVQFGYENQRLDWLTQAIGVLLVLTACGMVASPWWLRRIKQRQVANGSIEAPSSHLTRKQVFGTIGAGAILGLCVALTSVGAGALGSMALWLLYPLRLTAHRLVGTDLAHAIPLALIPGLVFLWANMVDITLLVNLLLGSVPAIWCSSHLARRIPAQGIRLALAVVLILAALKIWQVI